MRIFILLVLFGCSSPKYTMHTYCVPEQTEEGINILHCLSEIRAETKEEAILNGSI